MLIHMHKVLASPCIQCHRHVVTHRRRAFQHLFAGDCREAAVTRAVPASRFWCCRSHRDSLHIVTSPRFTGGKLVHLQNCCMMLYDTRLISPKSRCVCITYVDPVLHLAMRMEEMTSSSLVSRLPSLHHR